MGGEGRGGAVLWGEVRSEPRCQRLGSVPCGCPGNTSQAAGTPGPWGRRLLVYSRSNEEPGQLDQRGKGRQRRGGPRWESGPEAHQSD